MRQPRGAIPIWLAVLFASLAARVSATLFPLRATTAKVTTSEHDVTGLYYSITDSTERDRWLHSSNLCHEHAQFVKEPYTRDYEPRDSLEEIEGDIPLAYWTWHGNITLKQFNFGYKHPLVMKYKIVNGKVYYQDKEGIPDLQHVRRVEMEELLRVTIHLYPIPDMEFLMHFGDNSFSQRPVLTMAIFRHFMFAGFTMPSYSIWKRSLGPLQMGIYHGCLKDRYPASNGTRIRQVVWRGSNTGKTKHANLATCMNLTRVKLHLLGQNNPDIMDVHLNLLVPPCTSQVVGALLSDINTTRMRAEDFNRYCVILDADGNSWSDRFATNLVHYPSPILKQATNATGYADHFFTKGVEVEYFHSNLEDLLPQARAMVADCARGDSSRGQAMARRMQSVARTLFSHVGVARAMAYALVNYKRMSAWAMDRSLVGFRLVDTPCCAHMTLPPELKAAINQRHNLTTSPPPPPY